MMPRILISGPEGSRINYENAIRQAGGEPCSFYLPPVDDSYDALLLGGGGDILPSYFGQEDEGSYDIDPERDKIELELTECYIRAGKPILGICRGHQVLNVVLGGDIIQDIGDELRPFHTPGDLPTDQIHTVCSAEGSFLRELYGLIFPVNSYHHQAVGKIGTGLQAVAWTESGLVEAFQHETLPIRSMQWHPERMSYEKRRMDTVDGAPIFDWLIAEARKFALKR